MTKVDRLEHEISRLNTKIERKKQSLINKDRKSVVQGKSVDLGGRRIIKKKKKNTNNNNVNNKKKSQL